MASAHALTVLWKKTVPAVTPAPRASTSTSGRAAAEDAAGTAPLARSGTLATLAPMALPPEEVSATALQVNMVPTSSASVVLAMTVSTVSMASAEIALQAAMIARMRPETATLAPPLTPCQATTSATALKATITAVSA